MLLLTLWACLASAQAQSPDPRLSAAPQTPPFYSIFPEVRLREHSGDGFINVHRDGDLTLSSSVELKTREARFMMQRAAVPGEDYISTSTTVAFQPGEATKAVAIQLLDDAVAEPPKMLEVLLTNATGRTPDWFYSGQVWIDDDDFNPLPLDPHFRSSIQYRPRSARGDDLTLPNLPDGKFIIPIFLPSATGENAWGLARLSPNGARDESFVSPVFDSYPVFALLTNGQVLVGTDQRFRANDGYHSGIARLQTNGSIDATFGGPNLSPTALAVQSDGKILVATETSLLRLQPGGAIDPTFSKLEVDWINPWRSRITIDSNGRLLLQPAAAVNGKITPGIARILNDGSLDQSFSQALSALGSIEAAEISPGGKVLATYLDSEFSLVLVRLLDDGNADPTFQSALHHSQYRFVPVPGDKIIIIDRDYSIAPVIRLNADGSMDHSFSPATYSTSASGWDVASRAIVNGGLLVLGEGLRVNGRLAPVRFPLETPPFRLELDYASATAIETNAISELKLVRTGPASDKLTVHWETTAEGTAQPGVDFVTARGDLLFSEGQNTAVISIQLLDNHRLDGERDLLISLTGPTGPLPPVTFTLIDDELGFVSHRLLSNGFVSLNLTGSFAAPTAVETSENLRDWHSANRVFFGSQLYDLAASGSNRFFRLLRVVP